MIRTHENEPYPAHAGQLHPHLYDKHEANVGSMERVVSSAGGLGLLAYGISTTGPMRWISAAAGSALLWHGVKQRSMLYESLGITGEDAFHTSTPLSRDIHSRSSVTIEAPADQLYEQWLSLEHLSRFFLHVTHIERLDDRRSRWTATLAGGREICWVAEHTEQRQNEMIAWHTVGSPPVAHHGRISFRPSGRGRSTVVTLEMHLHLPGGALGAMFAKAMGRDPGWEASEALRRFKQWIEAGEIASARSPAARDDGWNGHSLYEEAAGGTRQPLGATTQTSATTAGATPTGAAAPSARDSAVRSGHTPTRNEAVDEASEESFPASDAPAFNP